MPFSMKSGRLDLYPRAKITISPGVMEMLLKENVMEPVGFVYTAGRYLGTRV